MTLDQDHFWRFLLESNVHIAPLHVPGSLCYAGAGCMQRRGSHSERFARGKLRPGPSPALQICSCFCRFYIRSGIVVVLKVGLGWPMLPMVPTARKWEKVEGLQQRLRNCF